MKRQKLAYILAISMIAAGLSGCRRGPDPSLLEDERPPAPVLEVALPDQAIAERDGGGVVPIGLKAVGEGAYFDPKTPLRIELVGVGGAVPASKQLARTDAVEPAMDSHVTELAFAVPFQLDGQQQSAALEVSFDLFLCNPKVCQRATRSARVRVGAGGDGKPGELPNGD